MTFIAALALAQAAGFPPAPMPVPVPHLPPAPNYAFDCAVHPADDNRPARVQGTVSSQPTDRQSNYTGGRITLSSTDSRFGPVTASSGSTPSSIQGRISVDSDLSTSTATMRTTRYSFEFPASPRTIPLRATLAIRVQDYDSEYGDRFVLTAVGLCELSELEGQR